MVGLTEKNSYEKIGPGDRILKVKLSRVELKAVDCRKYEFLIKLVCYTLLLDVV